MDIKGTVSVITGGASGMGAATAELLTRLGSKVVLLDRNEKAVAEKARGLSGKAYACDVSNASEVESVFEQIQAELGSPAICVNCAGICPAQRIVGKEGVMPLEAFTQTINVNLVGTFNVMRMAAYYMSLREEALNESGERGVIINTASVAAFEGQIGQAAYSASKGGVVAMTLPAARELARNGIRVMAIAPGIVETPMILAMPEKVQESLASQVPFPARLARPSEFANLVRHIIENQMLNGEVIRLDGAIRMQAK